MRGIALAALALSSVASDAYAQTNLVVNGDFEAAPSTGVGVISLTNGQSMPGWSVSRGGIDLVGKDVWPTFNGSKTSVDLSLLSAGSISQTIRAQAPGTVFKLGFDFGASTLADPLTKSMTVSVGNGQSYNFTRNSTNESGKPNWVHQEINFVSPSGTPTLTFASNTDTAFGPLLDNVTLTASGVMARTLNLVGRNTGTVLSIQSPQFFAPPPPATTRLACCTSYVTVVKGSPIVPPNPKAKMFWKWGTKILTFALGRGIKSKSLMRTGSNAGTLLLEGDDSPDAYAMTVDLDASDLWNWSQDGWGWEDGAFGVAGTITDLKGNVVTDTFDVTASTEIAPLDAFGAVPEPATWGMMIAGIGIVGAAQRRRQRRTLAAAA